MQRWTEIPPHIRTQHKEVPDIWKEALGLENKKGKVRLQSVPLPVLTSLDEHAIWCIGGDSQERGGHDLADCHPDFSILDNSLFVYSLFV